MTAFLFVQKFTDGMPTAMPFQPMMDRLSRYGAIGRGRGDLEITLQPDKIAALCTVIGNSESGITCVGFERPRYDADLRRLVWELMERFACAVFDDTLDTVCSPLDGLSALPADLVAACTTEAREINSAQQLWPDEFEIGIDAPPRPALRYTNPNSNGPNFQFCDYAVFEKHELYIELNLRPEACNSGTLRLVRNLELRIDAALSINSEYSILYRYADQRTSLAMLESPRLAELANRAVIITPMFGEEMPKNNFAADREIFASELFQAMKMTQYADENLQINLDGSRESIAALAQLLDDMHSAYVRERNAHTSESAFTSAVASQWGVMAGGYLGTVIRQQIGAQWGTITRGQSRLRVLHCHRGHTCNPHHLVLDHIINGPRSSVARHFNLLAQDSRSACPREEDLVCNIPGFCQILLGQSQFSSGGGLPFENNIPRDKLDFSVASLRQLDRYLAQVARQAANVSELALSNLILTAGAYLGEVIRGSNAEAGFWHWVSYDDFALAQPDFSQKRPREFGFMAFLDSPQQMTYPLAHVAMLLSGANITPTYDFVQQLLDKATDSQTTPNNSHTETTQHSPIAATPTATIRKSANKEVEIAERLADMVSGLFGILPRIAAWLLIVHTLMVTLPNFIRLAEAWSSELSIASYVWMASPFLLLAWGLFNSKRNFLKDSGLLFSGIMLVFFSVGVYETFLSPPSSADFSVLIWVPIVQWLWIGGWMIALGRKA